MKLAFNLIPCGVLQGSIQTLCRPSLFYLPFTFVSVGELWLERPLETAMLLSLVGVASVVSNQWHCQLSDNRHKLDTYLTGEFNLENVFSLLDYFLPLSFLLSYSSSVDSCSFACSE